MVTFPNAKINLGLYIVRKRDDGFHDIETLFYPIALKDALEIVTLDGAQKIQLHQSGLSVVDDPTRNLVYRAAELLMQDHPSIPNLEIHLHKAIPSGGGLGGGSADAAFTLKMLNEKFNLKISKDKLLDYALQLGSDVPFFIINKACIATGRGEFLETISFDLSEYKIFVVNPGIAVSTATAFSKIKPKSSSINLREAIIRPISEWKNTLVNDFEEVIFELHPSIKKIKQTLYDAGALYASMSGSGSTVFGIFKKEIDENIFPAGYFRKIIRV